MDFDIVVEVQLLDLSDTNIRLVGLVSKVVSTGLGKTERGCPYVD